MKKMKSLLMIVPKKKGHMPIIDVLTRKTVEILHYAKVVGHMKGWHTCVCGAKSDSAVRHVELSSGEDYLVEINSLAVHYIACHRDEVPAEQIQMILDAYVGIPEKTWDMPTMEELQIPGAHQPSFKKKRGRK